MENENLTAEDDEFLDVSGLADLDEEETL